MSRIDDGRAATLHGLGAAANGNGEPETGYGPGAVIARRYRLHAQIGAGGMATVWRAVDLATGAPVAIKLALPDEHHEDTAVRMRTEARLETELVHPGIVRSLGHGRTPRGDAFLVLELLQGQSLRRFLELRGPLPAVYAVRMLLPIADALCFVHDRAVVHRDLKPDNVFIASERGRLRPKVLDFGIAKAPWSDARTRRGAVVGSPGYMAPEQACGLRDLDHRVDVWAFCALVREVIGGSAVACADAQTRRGAGRSVFELRPASAFDHHPELWSIVRRGMAFDRDVRFASMHELRRALIAWLLAQGATEDVCGNRLPLPAPAAQPRARNAPRPAAVQHGPGRRERRHVVYLDASAAAG